MPARIFLREPWLVYKPRTTMKEFFDNHPWLRKYAALYDAYIKEDFRLKNEEIFMKNREYIETNYETKSKLFFEKKTK